MKKVTYAVAIVMLSAMVCGCQKQTKTVSLYDRGLEIVSNMEELTKCDNYNELLGAEELEDTVNELKQGDYKNPKSVYKVTLPENILENIFMDEEQEEKQEEKAIKDLSPYLKGELELKLFQGLPVSANSYYGVQKMAAVSVFSVNQTFVNNEIDKNQYYVYVFENGYPIIVDFVVGEDSAVNATGHFIMTKEFEDSVQGIEELMNRQPFYKVQVEKI